MKLTNKKTLYQLRLLSLIRESKIFYPPGKGAQRSWRGLNFQISPKPSLPDEALSKAGGDGGNRTRVRKQGPADHYVRSLSLILTDIPRQTGKILAYHDLVSPDALVRNIRLTRLCDAPFQARQVRPEGNGLRLGSHGVIIVASYTLVFRFFSQAPETWARAPQLL
jgi:hypothetical protein